MTTLGDAQLLIPGAVVVGDAALTFDRVHTDSRTLQPGDLFVALRGERFDGHDFLDGARAAGAVAALAEQGLAAPSPRSDQAAGMSNPPGMPGLQVPDTLAALQALAAGWRARWPGTLMAVTGSNGKTTVTQMLAAIARAAHGEAALATQGNLNNHIGVPLTLLRLRQGAARAKAQGQLQRRVDGPQGVPAQAVAHVVAVLELGTNHPGEIALLARLAAPTVALVNNAQREHQEFLDGIEAVARENGSVLQALPPDGVAVFPADDPMTPLWRQMAGTRRVLTFARMRAEASAAAAVGAATFAATAAGEGAGEHADGPAADRTAERADHRADHRADAGTVRCSATWDSQAAAWGLSIQTPAGDVEVRLAMPGLHNVDNALAATATALAAGLPLSAVARGLEAFRAVGGRSRLVSTTLDGRPVTLVDDSYNANPDSVRAAIDLLAELPGPRWMLLGDMAEVGSQGPAFHAEVGDWARTRGLDALWCVGAASAATAAAAATAEPIARHFPDVEAAREALADPAQRPKAASVLVKGSRSMRMERLVQDLLALREGSDAA